MSVELRKRLEELDGLYAGVAWPLRDAAGEAEAAAIRERMIRDGVVGGLLPSSEARLARITAPLGADVAYVDAGPMPRLLEQLRAAFGKVSPSGTIVARVRWPWDTQFYNVVSELGLKVVAYEREALHRLFPSLHVLDGGGDVVLLSAGAPPREGVEIVQAPPPYAWCDLDGLDAAKIAERPLERLSERVAELLGVKPELSDVVTGEERSILAWYAPSALGFVAELQPEAHHLLVSYVPYDDAIDDAVMTAAFELFGNADTRARPRRTERTPERTVFA